MIRTQFVVTPPRNQDPTSALTTENGSTMIIASIQR
jgi:hypothetical protein